MLPRIPLPPDPPTESPHPDPQSRGEDRDPVVALVCLLTFLHFTAEKMRGPVLPLYAAAHGATATGVGLIVGAHMVIAAAGSILLGHAADVWGRRPLLLGGMAVGAVTSLLLPLAKGQLALMGIYAGWYAGADPWASIYGPPLRLAKDARRLDISPAWLAWAGTVPALDLLADVGIAAIQRHDLALANALRGRLGLPPGDSAIVTVAAEGGLERLRATGIKASVRAGAVRLSFHLHNTEADVDAVARALGY